MNGPRRLAEDLRDAVLSVPGVARLTPGGPIEAATLYPGGKVVGVRLGDPVQVHVALDRLPVGPLAERVRAAVRSVLERNGDHRPVEVVVDDLDEAALTATGG